MLFHHMSPSETTRNSSVALNPVLHRKLWPSTWDKKSFGVPFVLTLRSLVRVRFRGLTTVRFCYELLFCFLSELTRRASGQRGRLHPGFRRFSRPLRRRTSLQCQLGNLHWQDSHMLDHQDHQLASLHYPGALLGRFFNNNDYHGQPDASLGHPPTSFEGNKKNRPIKAWAGQPTVFEWAGSSPGSRVRARLVWFSILGLARLQFLY
jgi:hypothetical protein